MGLRIGQDSGELIGGQDAGIRKNLGELRGRSGSAVGGGKAWFGPDDGARIFLSLERIGNEKKQEQGRGRKKTGGMIHDRISQSREE